MWLYFPVDLTSNLIMIEKLVLGEIWTGDLPIFNPGRANLCAIMTLHYKGSIHVFQKQDERDT